MLEKLKARFCDEATHWYKMWSTWLAVAWGTIITALWNDPTVFGAIAGAVPEKYRAGLSPVIFFVTTGLPIIVRLLKQRKLPPPPSGN